MLRPVHGRDRLWVLHEKDNIDATICYLRHMPFGEKQTHAVLPDGVTSILKRKAGWLVKKKQSDGSVKHIFTKELDDAAMLVNVGESDARTEQ